MAKAHDYIGRKIYNYRIIEKLASGSFGSVYKAQHVILTDRIVAIKLMHAANLQSQEGSSGGFLKEARLLEKLKHKHILPIIDIGVERDVPYLIAEYAVHGSLRDRLKRHSPRPLAIEEALTILTQIGQALQHAHTRNIIHRDLKPENILFNVREEAMLCDFGIATVLNTMSMKNVDTSGTPAYMAPEQFESKISKECDQYALGCIAYELVTGHRPFTAPNVYAMWYQHANVVPTPPSHYNPQLPGYMEQAILKAMAKERRDRHEDILTFIAMLTTPASSPELSTSENKATVPAIPTQAVRLLPQRDASRQSKLQWLHEGNGHYEAGRYHEAIAAYECAIQLDPRSSTAHNKKGQALEALGQYQEALAAYEQAILCDANYKDAWQNKGNVLYTLKRYSEAITAYERVIRLAPNSASGYHGKGNALLKLQRHEEALQAHQRALLLDTTFAGAYDGKGNALRELGKSEEALEAYNKAMRLNPHHANFYTNKGLALYNLKCYSEALKAYNQAIDLHPEEGSYYYHKGRALQALNRNEEALKAYEVALHFNDNDAQAYTGKGNALWNLGRYEEALSAYEQAIQLDPEAA
ncbi:MAG TPA: tetratricopeptide repeat protein, partial [Ktedonobacteraceae bacterium]|nr:tetratricopeptide repeat protein [Ktedonobacteraceae bacterium]